MDSDHKQQLVNRLKTIEGHVRGVQRMVERDTYCIDLLKQTRAIQQALAKLDALILEEHLRTCVATAIGDPNVAERERVVRELLQLYETKQSG